MSKQIKYDLSKIKIVVGHGAPPNASPPSWQTRKYEEQIMSEPSEVEKLRDRILAEMLYGRAVSSGHAQTLRESAVELLTAFEARVRDAAFDEAIELTRDFFDGEYFVDALCAAKGQKDR